MVTKFEETGSFNVSRGKGRKPVFCRPNGGCCASGRRGQSYQRTHQYEYPSYGRNSGYAYSTVQNILRHILRYYPYKLQFVKELLPHDFESRHLFSLEFLDRLEVDSEWPWNILWTDEVHFHLDGSVNTHNCRIWQPKNPHSILQVPLQSANLTVCCGFTAAFIFGQYFFDELTARGPITYSITGKRCATLLCGFASTSVPFTHNIYSRWSSSTY